LNAGVAVLQKHPDVRRDDIDRQQKARIRRHVMASLASSLGEFDRLYRELAK